MNTIKKLTLVVFCLATLVFLAGCDYYSTSKSLNYEYSLGEIADVLYISENTEEKTEFVFRIEYVEYEETDTNNDDYYGIYTIGYNHTSYRSDFEFEIINDDDSSFKILDHDKKKMVLTVADLTRYEHGTLCLRVTCPPYVSDANYETLKLNFEIDLSDRSVYDDPSLDDYEEKLELKLKKIYQDKEDARRKEVREKSTESFIASFIMIAFIFMISVLPSKRLRCKIRARCEEVTAAELLDPNFKKRKPCSITRALGILSFVLSVLQFLPSSVMLGLSEYAMFLPTFVCLLSFTAGLTSFILRIKFSEKHGLDIAGIIITLPPLLLAVSYLF